MLVERTLQVERVSVLLRQWGSSGMPVLFWHALGDHSSMQMAEVGPILVKDYGYASLGLMRPASGVRPPDSRIRSTKCPHSLLSSPNSWMPSNWIGRRGSGRRGELTWGLLSQVLILTGSARWLFLTAATGRTQTSRC